jgi:ABC-2 type transport system permease protein
MSPVLTLAGKDLRLLRRHRGDFFFVVGWPIVLAVLFGVIFAAPPEGRSPLAVAVADEDGTDGSRSFVSRLGAGGGLDVAITSRAEAEALVRQGKAVAWVALAPGFGAAAENPFGGAAPTVVMGMDPTRRAEAAMLEGLLAREAAALLQERLSDREASRRMVADALARLRHAPPWSPERKRNERFLAELDLWLASAPEGRGGGPSLVPLVVESRAAAPERRGPRRSFEFTFPQGMLWGLIACAANFAISLVKERTSGTMGRLLTAPITRRQILLGKAVACLAAMLAVEALLVAVGTIGFGVRPASWPLLAAALLAAAAAFTGIMMALSAVGTTEQAASGAAWATLLVLALLGGGMVPLFVMPSWMATASGVSPAKWAILAFEGALWRGFTPAEMALPLGVLLAIGGAGLLAGSRLVRTH